MNRTATMSTTCMLAGVLLSAGCATTPGVRAAHPSNTTGGSMTPTLTGEERLTFEQTHLPPIGKALVAEFGVDPDKWTTSANDGREGSCGLSTTGSIWPRSWAYDVHFRLPAKDALSRVDQVLQRLPTKGWALNPVPNQRDADGIEQDVFKDGYAATIGATSEGFAGVTIRSSCYAEDGSVAFRHEPGQ